MNDVERRPLRHGPLDEHAGNIKLGKDSLKESVYLVGRYTAEGRPWKKSRGERGNREPRGGARNRPLSSRKSSAAFKRGAFF